MKKGKSKNIGKAPKGKIIGGKGYTPCYESHPVIKIGGGTFTGGSCSTPVTVKHDVMIGLDFGMRCFHTRFPWEEDESPVIEFLYKITDMSEPSNPDSFKKMISWLKEQYEARPGLRVHVGCIGGHGRTGMVLAALVKEIMGKKDAIQWVRKHYCEKAVETEDQVDFLVKHFKVSTAEATKSFGSFGSWGGYYGGSGSGSTTKPDKTPTGYSVATPVTASWSGLSLTFSRDVTEFDKRN